MRFASSWSTLSTDNNNYYFLSSFYVSGSVLSTYIHIHKWFKYATKFETLAVAHFYTYIYESTKGFQDIVRGETLAFSSTSPKWIRISGQAVRHLYILKPTRLPSECLRTVNVMMFFHLSFTPFHTLSPGLQWNMNLWVSHSHSLSIIWHSWVGEGQLRAKVKCFNI